MFWLVFLLFISCASCLGGDRCPSSPEQTTEECVIEYGWRQSGPAFFKIGEDMLTIQPLLLELKSKSPNKECALTVNIEQISKKFTLSTVSIHDTYIYCHSAIRVSFCRPENFTTNDAIMYLGLEGECRVTDADLAVWGRVGYVFLLTLRNGVMLLEDRNATEADFKRLLKVGAVILNNLKNKALPRIFQTYVWEELAEFHLANMPLTKIPSTLKLTMPHLQSLWLTGTNIRGLPDFPWCNRSLVTPRNMSRTLYSNKYYSEGATVNPRFHRRFLVANFNPLIRDLKSPAGSLDKISLRGNNLRYINATIFARVTNLKVIDLSSNKLGLIPERLFEKASDLVHVNLANNHLTSLNGKTFENLKNLRKLDLRGNFIHTLRNGFLTDRHKNLEEINLENNTIRTVEAHAFPRRVFDALKKINFRQNKLREVPQFGFYVRNLETFDCSDNEVNFAGFVNTIDSLNLPDFVYVHSSSGSSVESKDQIKMDFQKRKTLNLRRNRIKRFDLTNFNKTRLLTLDFILKAFTIILTGNPLHCDCKTRELQRKLLNLSKTAKEITERDFESWVCHTPKELKGLKILSVPPEKLNCKSCCPKCPSRCTCHRSYSKSLVFVDCRRRNLTAVPNEFPNGMVELHLEHNEIENLTVSKNMENVSLLYGSHNNLERIHLKHFPSKLREIYLDSNKLTTLPREFQNLDISRIDLQNNYFTCDCENYWMKSWLKRDGKAFIGGADSVVCSSAEDNRGKSLVSVKDTDFICLKLVKTNKDGDNKMTSVHAISAYVIAAFLLVVIISALFLYCFRKELKLILYTRFNWHPFDHVDDSDPSKIYDAFVSFNEGDIVWVMETLREKLENHNPPYKLCIHCRDFIPGAPIAENILDSVKTSRRMIMVLSRNFIQSEWCMLEFRAAHRRVLKGRANYLIIVLVDDVDVENLDEELKLYLKTNTYLSVQSKWFWQQLKYALPQKKLDTIDDC